MGSIIKRGAKYRAEISKLGKRKSATFKTKSEAQQWIYEEERKVEMQHQNGLVDILFKDVIERYQREVSPLKKTGAKEVKLLNRFIDDPIANKFISDITREDVEHWITSQVMTGIKGSSVRRYTTVLSNIFTFALTKWDYITKNPMIGAMLPQNTKPRNQRFTIEEITTIATAMRYSTDSDLKRVSARVGGAFLFAIETAMRAGEIANLTWENVHFDKRIAHLPMTKNGTARDVPLSMRAIEILRQFEKVKSGELVFNLKTQSISAIFYNTKTTLGLHHLDFHDTRREALSRLAKKVDVMTLAKISGHKDIKILLNTYYAPDMSEVAISLG
ncbi:MAG: site-specific integrase [Pasteurellaceae bacterium]|nr:site-specific integrase [Pasteurellaceae bacterium]